MQKKFPWCFFDLALHRKKTGNMSEEVKSKILNGAGALFLKFGFKSITMDDIARELGISKKTLYQFFEDKPSLVDHAVMNHIHAEENACLAINHQETNPVAYMLMITESFSDVKKQINQSILFDLRKYFKPTWDKLNLFRMEFVYKQVLENIIRGKEMGFYHAGIDENLTARFYISLVDFMLNPDNYANADVDLKSVHAEMMRYHLRSISTDKGMKLLMKSSLYPNNK